MNELTVFNEEDEVTKFNLGGLVRYEQLCQIRNT